MSSVIIEAAGVGRTFTSHAGLTEALSDMSLSVDAGEFVSIIGPSGCGKSTSAILVACALGLLFYGAVALLERVTMPWRVEREET
jgi:ABC-type nitrate/sulfonate/bicarbonate transport system ATPase subunit